MDDPVLKSIVPGHFTDRSSPLPTRLKVFGWALSALIILYSERGIFFIIPFLWYIISLWEHNRGYTKSLRAGVLSIITTSSLPVLLILRRTGDLVYDPKSLLLLGAVYLIWFVTGYAERALLTTVPLKKFPNSKTKLLLLDERFVSSGIWGYLPRVVLDVLIYPVVYFSSMPGLFSYLILSLAIGVQRHSCFWYRENHRQSSFYS